MDGPNFFCLTLGLFDPWQMTAISFSDEEKRVYINVDFIHGSTFSCPVCGGDGKVGIVEDETWYHHNLFRFEAYLYARVPRIDCISCGIAPVERPWLNAASKFCLI